jgi:preprotein translocase subunit SecG
LLYYILLALYILSCFILILFVLLQPGKSDAAAVFGGGVGSAAFGPRGTQTVLAKVTIGAAIVFFTIAFLFSMPGLFGKRSLGEGVGPAEQSQPIRPAPTNPASPTSSQPTSSENNAAKPAEGKSNAQQETQKQEK